MLDQIKKTKKTEDKKILLETAISLIIKHVTLNHFTLGKSQLQLFLKQLIDNQDKA